MSFWTFWCILTLAFTCIVLIVMVLDERRRRKSNRQMYESVRDQRDEYFTEVKQLRSENQELKFRLEPFAGIEVPR